MGGTSTDVSRFSNTFEHTFENTTAGVTIQTPQLGISTIFIMNAMHLYSELNYREI
jgi:N-methylhydantoinase A/oxoprolinase/acetone carboxylase beta subunit